ncbi:hypothetical protein [Candidatus Parabeggiatoa sp. HSG14]|uniref:hypothetical protein n=1 Tax=Candidatus Parabeggiatoa sp. HSG14 TaxID=3055593 RepID=UPI0025A6C4F9|nr:hypothetical protein [Thiotrichales bacterium HSG14]
MNKLDTQDARIDEILENCEGLTSEECVDDFYNHLVNSLQLPCDVTGIEDFKWEEYYVAGQGNSKEYKKLRKEQPSYKDKYELLAIKNDVESEWMLFYDEDLTGHVRRKGDGKEFYLGLSELKVIGKKSANYQLLDDYAVWFVNNR